MSNILYKVGASATVAVTLGDYGGYGGGYWVPKIEDPFMRYEVHFSTSINSWQNRQDWEASLANSLGLGPLQLVVYPRGGGRVVSFANSGGSLVNTFTSTTITSVFPETIAVEEFAAWGVMGVVTFVRAR